MQTVSLLCTKKTICVEKKKTLGDNKREVNSNISQTHKLFIKFNKGNNIRDGV